MTEFEQDFAFDRYCRPSFLGMEVSTDVVIGRYRPVAGVEGEFNAGVNLGIEGAWFMNPYVGFGGRTAVSSVPIKLNVAESTDRLDSWAASAGAYFHIRLRHAGGPVARSWPGISIMNPFP